MIDRRLARSIAAGIASGIVLGVGLVAGVVVPVLAAGGPVLEALDRARWLVGGAILGLLLATLIALWARRGVGR